MRSEPTPRQIEVLQHIRDLTAAKGYPPTLADLRDELRVASLNTARCHVQALAAKGLVEVGVRVARSVRLTAAGHRVLRRAA
jgi:repressor LexA